MGGKRKGYSLTCEETASLIEEIAERIANGDRSFDLQLPLQQAQEALLKMHHVDGLRLLSRIGLLLITENGKAPSRYDYVRKTVEALPPLDSTEDSNALRSLADDIRSGTGD